MSILFVTGLNELEYATLQAMYRHHPNHYTRLRAHSILLSDQGRRVFDIADILSVHRQSVASWLHAWEDAGPLWSVGTPSTRSTESIEQR